MATRTGIEKAALLLYSLPPESADKVLAALAPAHGERLRSELEKLRRSHAEHGNEEGWLRDVDEVVREFEELLRQTDAAPPAAPTAAPTPRQLAAYRPPSDPDISLPEESSLPPLPSDPVQALHTLPPELLTDVLQGEQAHTIALVLNDLPSEKAGEVLRQLTPEMRREVSVRLSRLSGSSPELLARIARALVQRSQALSGKRSDTSADAKYEKMASMLRCLEKAERMEVIAALEENEPETAGRIKELLYTFEDLLRVHDRSLQKLLSEIDSKTLSVALKGANESISEKLLANLSKRAREALKEEMEFVGMVPLPQVRQAQKMIVDVMQRLDQAGELMMSE
ncbi:MAG TPA: FliG C-terminal domain-containing protein [Gemmataceae bacterium]|nr:FliG C-terminal domain-containing protein [Gemmataceae bacterium]